MEALVTCPPGTDCCLGYYPPEPWLDNSSPRRIHVGGHIDCDYIDEGLWFQIELYTIVGDR